MPVKRKKKKYAPASGDWTVDQNGKPVYQAGSAPRIVRRYKNADDRLGDAVSSVAGAGTAIGTTIFAATVATGGLALTAAPFALLASRPEQIDKNYVDTLVYDTPRPQTGDYSKQQLRNWVDGMLMSSGTPQASARGASRMSAT